MLLHCQVKVTFYVDRLLNHILRAGLYADITLKVIISLNGPVCFWRLFHLSHYVIFRLRLALYAILESNTYRK